MCINSKENIRANTAPKRATVGEGITIASKVVLFSAYLAG